MSERASRRTRVTIFTFGVGVPGAGFKGLRARPSPHGNIRASRAHSLTCSAVRMPAPWAAADPVGRAERPPYTIRQARDHPQHAAARRAALPASLSCTAQ